MFDLFEQRRGVSIHHLREGGLADGVGTLEVQNEPDILARLQGAIHEAFTCRGIITGKCDLIVFHGRGVDFLFGIDALCSALGIHVVAKPCKEPIGRGGGLGQWPTEA